MSANPIGKVEEAIFLLRRQDMRAWAQYLIGAVPLLLMLLKFLHDMSAGFLGSRCAEESLFCALAYWWASAWKAKFGGTLLASMNGSSVESPKSSFWRALYLQGVFQSVKLAVLPFAAVSVLAIAWTSLFFRSAAIEASQPKSTLGSIFGKSAKRANAAGTGNWLSFAILVVIGLIAFLNIYILTALLPFLLRMFSGIETNLTRYAGGIFTFNILCLVVMITWFVMDPLVLAYSVVRCFYADARTDGRDLLAQLRPVAAAALLLVVLAPFSHAFGTEAVSKERLSRGVAQAAQSDEYQWLRAKHPPKEAEDGWAEGFHRDLEKFFAKINAWIKEFEKWWNRVTRDKGPADPEPNGKLALGGDVRLLLYVLAGIVLVAALVFLWRSRSNVPQTITADTSRMRAPDLNQENVLASDLPEDEWMRLARELLGKGELRLAVRAMYLSNLSYLGAQQLIRIARSKSNSIYEREVRQRPRGTEILIPFTQSNRSFERAWYGFHEVTIPVVEEFQHDMEAIRQHAQA